MDNKKRKYYKIGEKVFLKGEKVVATVTDLDVVKDVKYDVTVEFTKDGETQTKVVRLWEITKLNSRKPFNRKRSLAPLTIKVKYFDGAGNELTKLEQGDWIDLRSAETIELKHLQFHKLPLGIAMELPKGFEAHVAPRSSTYNKWGIIQANGVGVVDESYCGDNDQWFIPIIALRDTKIEKGDRIAQFRIVRKMNKVNLVTVDHLGNKDRGGFGSTGIK